MQKTDTLLVSAILVLGILLTVTVAFIFHEKKQTTTRSEAYLLQEIDDSIQNGFSQHAREEILKLSSSDISAATYIRLLKRAWIISQLQNDDDGNDDLFAVVAEKAYKKYPARQDVGAIYAYTLLRTNSQAEAVEIVDSGEWNDDIWTAVSNEVYLYSGNDKPQLTRESGTQKFLDMYDLTDSSGFLLDAALLLLESGEPEQAFSLVQRDESQRIPQRFRFFLACDALQWNAAYNILQRYPQLFPQVEQQLLKADILMRTGRFQDAKREYSRILRLSEEAEWTAGYNLIFLDLQENGRIDDELSREVMTRASRYSDGERKDTGTPSAIAVDIAGLTMAFGENRYVEMLLSRYESGVSLQPEIEILREAARTTVNPERYASLLWRLVSVEEYPEHAVHLAWFLLGVEDLSGLRNLMEISRKRYGDLSWISFFQGILFLYESRFEDAAEYFHDAYDADENWCSAYNAAVAYHALGRPEAALEQLRQAEGSLNRNSPHAADKMAVVLLKKVELYLQSGDYELADKVLSEIELEDPGNIQAALYRNYIRTDAKD